uniref:Uncharacterized protein n=1 Tax=Zea mays TaxID=4577 RepID=A0A804N7R3_MAIZE
MARQRQVASMLAAALLVATTFASIPTTVHSIGVCYGTLGNNLPSSSDVVQLYRSKGIKGMRIYSPDDTRSLLPAMRNLDAALARAGFPGIKCSTSVRFDVVANSFPPSSGSFAQGYMADVARYLAGTGAPLLANVYPYFAYRDNPRDISLGYATFQPGTTVRDNGNGLNYNNLFDAMVDAVVAALEKAGAPNVRVVVSESGWPSAGGFGASVDNARKYNQGLIDHVGRGTPKRTGPLETFVFAMFNENQKGGDPTEKNFGLFYGNKQPVYPIRFN